jgi:hypothetical protein
MEEDEEGVRRADPLYQERLIPTREEEESALRELMM